LKVPPN